MGFLPEEGEDGEGADPEGRKDAKEDLVGLRQAPILMDASLGSRRAVSRGYPHGDELAEGRGRPLVEDLLVQVFGDPGPEAPEALGWKPNVIARLEA